MIPSDHFVYFYNEIFKYLAERGPEALDRYYRRVADRQAFFILDVLRREGLKGAADYYRRIRREENCDMEIDLRTDCLRLRMNRCPSLAKAMESDAGASPAYCDHCPGWCLRVESAAGLWEVFDLMAPDVPMCEEWIFTDRAHCRAKFEELRALRGAERVRTNLDDIPPFLANSIADSARFEFMNSRFGTAFGFLRETDLASLPLGKVEIDGDDVFAYVSSPELTPFGEGDVEVHRKYIDIHAPIVGEETFGSFTMTEREFALPFNERDDYALFKARTEPLTVRPGEFVAYFPPLGAHSPANWIGDRPAAFRKICVKVRA